MPRPLELAKVLQVIRDQIPDLRSRYGVRSLAIFGSVARGDSLESSDLDLLVRFESDPPGLLEFLEIEDHLSQLLDAKVDLVMESALKPSLRDRILEEAIAA